MRTLELREHATLKGVHLTGHELRALRGAVPSITISPSDGARRRWDVRPAAKVGLVTVGGLRIQIRPKLAIDRLLFLLGYAANPHHWRHDLSSFDDQEDLLEAIAAVFVRLLQPVVRGGLLQGYQTRDEALDGIRGRIRFEDQARRHGRRALPVEVRYDDFTVDVVENRLVAAAVRRLRRLPLRPISVRRSLRALEDAFLGVSHRRWKQAEIPTVVWTRLNARYRPAVDMARRILHVCSFDLGGSGVTAHGLLIDMNQLFEEFVRTALREALELDPHSFPPECRGRRLALDSAGQLSLHPDLSWWQNGQCVFVGDVKYKRDSGRGQRADLYQLLAYVLAAGQREGLLIYGDLTEHPQSHCVTHGRAQLRVTGLDLTRSPNEILAEVRHLALLIRAMKSQSSEEWSIRRLPQRIPEIQPHVGM